MYVTSFPRFTHGTLNISSGYIYFQLNTLLGKKRFSLGKETEKNQRQAIQVGYALDKAIEVCISKNETISLNALKDIVDSIRKPYLSIVEESKPTIQSLWNSYVEFHIKKGKWTETYIRTHIRTINSLINKKDFPTEIEQPSLIVDWLLKDPKRTTTTSKNRFKLIVTAIDWGSINGKCDRVLGIKYRDCLRFFSSSIEVETEELDVNSFSLNEINLILNALKNDTYSRFKGKHSQYYNYANFLWLTGCRPSEAIALKWDNVDFSNRKIKFCEGEILASGKVVKQKGTKTEPYRYMPMNNTLIEFLKSLPKTSEYVFVSDLGKPINQHAFNRVWLYLLPKLGIKYRVPYNLRHSMISYHINNNFPIVQLAKIVGNSPEIINAHYLKLDMSLINVPEILQ